MKLSKDICNYINNVLGYLTLGKRGGEKVTEITEKEERIMFHTLGYEYQPRWNDDKGGYRNKWKLKDNKQKYDLPKKRQKILCKY